ncbi:MAG: VOC family protein [Acidimicrobiales bacterium]
MTEPTSPTIGLRHAVLWVSDPAASAAFYTEALGLVIAAEMGGAVFMTSPGSATDHDLGLFQAATVARPAARQIGLYHLSWEVSTLEELRSARERLRAMGAYVGENNHGVSRSVYAQDPDGLEFEVMWEVPVELLAEDEPANIPLDLDADDARFGATTPGRGAR